MDPARAIEYLRRVIASPGYPPELCFFHCLHAVARWRVYRSDLDFLISSTDEETSMLRLGPGGATFPFDLVAPFFCHGFGGTTFRDWVIGEVPSLFKSDQITRHWLLAWLAVYFSPFDIVFRLMVRRQSPLRVIALMYEAIDSATTVSASVEKGLARFPDSSAAPVLLGLIGGVGGSVWRWIERRGRYEDVRTELAAPTRTFRQCLIYVLAHLWIRVRAGARQARFAVAAFHTAWTLVEDAYGVPFDWTRPMARYMAVAVRATLLLVSAVPSC